MPGKSKHDTFDSSEDAIRQRAYFLWEADGRPEGSGEHYWHLANEAVRASAASNGSAEKVAKPARKAAVKPVKAAAPKVKAAKPVEAKKVPKQRAAIQKPN
jgi:hypothetical protein